MGSVKGIPVELPAIAIRPTSIPVALLTAWRMSATSARNSLRLRRSVGVLRGVRIPPGPLGR